MIDASHWVAVRNETMVSIAINALIPTAIIWAVSLPPPQDLEGSDGLVQAMLKASGLATLLMTAVVTLLVRGRVRGGAVPPLDRSALPALIRFLPAAVWLRAPVMGIVAMVVLVPTGALIVSLLGVLPFDTGDFVRFNLAYGALVGLTMTPCVVLRALADPAKRAS